MKIVLFLILFIPVGIGNLMGQNSKEITRQNLAWTRYYNHVSIGNKWEWLLEVENRRYIFPSAQHQFVVRNQVVYKLTDNWSFAQGFTFFRQTFPQDPDATDYYVRPELRPQQEIIYKNKFSDKFSLQHRYRLDERFFRHTDESGNLEKGYDFNFRARYQLLLRYDLIKKETKKNALAITAFDEIQFNFGKEIVNNSFDQNRFGGALIYGISKSTEIETSYMKWFQQRSSGYEYYSRNIYRITLHQYFTIK